MMTMAALAVPPPLQRKKLLARSAAEILIDMSNEPLKKRARVEGPPPKTTIHACPKPDAAVIETSRLEQLPPDLFCRVLSLVGPLCNSLAGLSKANRNLHNIMESTSRAMLPKATLHFRVPLARMPNESCTSLLLRHTRACSRVVEDIKNLQKMVSKDNMTSEDSQQAMEKAMSLLQVAPAMSTALEKLVLVSSGKCGGKAFKLNKWQLLSEMAKPPPSEVQALKERRDKLTRYQERLDLSKLVMQIVVFRNLQLSRETQAPLSPVVLTHVLAPKVLEQLAGAKN